MKNLNDNTSFDFQRFGKFDYLVSVFFTPRYDLIGLLKVPISLVKALSNKNKRRYSFRINQNTLSDERVEKLIWKKDKASENPVKNVCRMLKNFKKVG